MRRHAVASLVASAFAIAYGSMTGCSSSTGDAIPDDASTDDSNAALDSAGLDGAGLDSPGADVADDTTSRDTGSKADVAADALADVAKDAPSDALGTLCEGFSSKPLVPPSVCDASSGNTSTEKPADSLYSTSWFGCYKKPDGTLVKDPTDNCLFACGDKGLCPGISDGPTCESTLKWFSADADRFGCGTRIRLTNCLNGKRVVLAALDRGPNCKNEKTYGTPVIDMSHDAMIYLFEGKTYGGSDKKRVVVEVVAASTPLGPEP